MHNPRPIHALTLPLLLLAVLFLTISCSTLLGGGRGPKLTPIHTGFNSLQMSFAVIPPSVFASETALPGFQPYDSAFPVVVKLANQGAADIEQGYLALGLEDDYVGLVAWELEALPFEPLGGSGKTLSFILQGRSEYNPYGQQELLPFTVRAKPLDVQSLQHTSSIGLTACYTYKTEATARICIDPDIYQTKPIQKVCQSKPQTLTQGQGSPVALSQLDTKMLPQEKSVVPQFIFEFQNKGSGLILNKQSIDKACSSFGSQLQDWNVAQIEDVHFSDFSLKRGEIECSSETILFRDNKAVLRCNLKPGLLDTSIDAYETTLTIILSYGYTFSISQPVLIERIQR